jgi:membrane associated rhomboid family serine protease
MLVPYNVDVPMARVPIANWVLIGVTCLVSLAAFLYANQNHADRDLERQLERAVQRGDEKEIERLEDEIDKRQEEAIPPLSLRWDRGVFLWLFTYQFVHGDVFHLLGNMIFLFVFGNAVNAKLGHWQFLVAYLLLGVLAGLAFLPLSGGRPIVGASGAIMGVVGLFVVLFPRNDVQIFYWFGLIWAGVTRIAAYWVVLFFVAGDLVGALFDHSGPVAYAAHLIGAAGGFALGIFLVKTRAVRSTRYEENLLECLGYQRKAERRRKKAKKVKRPRAERRTAEELLADGSDFDICEGMFRRVLRDNGGEVSAAGLGPEERVVVLVWHSLNVVNEDGFRALVEEGIVGDRRLVRTAEAYCTLGCVRAGNALRKAAAAVGDGDTGEYADERVGRSVRKWAGLPAAEQKKFIEVLDEVEARLAEYVRAHRDFFLTLDEEP